MFLSKNGHFTGFFAYHMFNAYRCFRNNYKNMKKQPEFIVFPAVFNDFYSNYFPEICLICRFIAGIAVCFMFLVQGNAGNVFQTPAFFQQGIEIFVAKRFKHENVDV